jgi:orotate phosphoribosyltransferase
MSEKGMRDYLKNRLKEVGAIRYGDFILSSGKKSNFYVDIKYASTFPDIINAIGDLMVNMLDKKIAGIACMELGGVPLSVTLSLKSSLPYIVFRKERKQYGGREEYIGSIHKGFQYAVVEDVTTTGNSALRVVEKIREKGGEVSQVLVVVDREEGARENLLSSGLENFTPIFNKSELLELVR